MKYYVLNYQNSGRSLSPLVKWGKEKDPLDKLAEIGQRFVWPQGLQLGSETKRGKLYDWLRCTFAPVVKERVKKRLEQVLTDEQVQWIGPFSLGRESYYLMNILTVIDCTTPESKYAYLYLKEDALEGVGICRIKQFLSKVLISEAFWWNIVGEEETGVYVNWLEEDGFIHNPWRVRRIVKNYWKFFLMIIAPVLKKRALLPRMLFDPEMPAMLYCFSNQAIFLPNEEASCSK